MLERLHIKNIAVIDEAEIEFKHGFNVLTGETGAGKSIIIDSINMVLGERTSKSLIRNGESKAVVEAMFYIDNKEVINRLFDLGVEAEDNVVILYRDINTDGKSVCKINGSMTTASNIRKIAEMLINIHGQQDNLSLLSPSSHIHFLNDYAKISSDLAAYREEHNLVLNLQDKIDSLQFDEQEKERQVDLFTFQIREIEAANLVAGEDEKLAERRKFLNSVEKISEAINSAHRVLYESDNNAYDVLSGAANELISVSKYDEKLDEIYGRLNSITIDLDDVIYQIRDYKDSISYNEGELDEIENRLGTINALKRKYGNSIEDILTYKDETEEKLKTIIQSDEEITKLKKELDIAKIARKKLADTLTSLRRSAAEELSDKIAKELADLDMSRVKFAVDIREGNFNTNGCDEVEFLISVNAGEPLKPLSKIASGGEMSRIMLAIKTIFANTDPVDTLIFDEIDTGVSGRAAQKIAEKINKISKNKQVLCITHLAQIAAMADTHFLIEKSMDNQSTFTDVKTLDDKQRQSELARIIGGAQITATTLEAAAEMIKQATEIRTKK